jgi:hypothetical protein
VTSRNANKMKHVLAAGALAAGILALVSCKDPSFFQALGEKIVSDSLTIAPPNVTVPVNGTVTFSASGGSQPYTFAVVPVRAGAINASTGAYTAPATQGTETVRVTDHKGNSADAQVTIAGNTGALAIRPASAASPAGTPHLARLAVVRL